MSKNNWIWAIIIVLVVGGISGVLFNRFVIPFLSNVPGLSWVQKLESNNPVIINRSTQVELNDGANLIDLTKQAETYTVAIYSTGASPEFLGNGIITTADGMVLASKADLPSSGNVIVILNDGTSYTGTVRALDPKSDLAVITISAQNLPFAQFVNASDLQVSQRVIFVGSSSNSFDHNFAIGFVLNTPANNQSLSQVMDSETLQDTITTDAKLSPAYFGGPVVNLDGKVVGMTNSSLGILIGEDLQSAVNLYLQSGKIQRPSLGIKYLNLSAELAKLKNLPQAGVQVVSVDAASPAAKAGILPNDLITAVDNQDLASNNFEQILNNHSISTMAVTIIRNGAKQNLTVTLIAK